MQKRKKKYLTIKNNFDLEEILIHSHCNDTSQTILESRQVSKISAYTELQAKNFVSKYEKKKKKPFDTFIIEFNCVCNFSLPIS